MDDSTSNGFHQADNMSKHETNRVSDADSLGPSKNIGAVESEETLEGERSNSFVDHNSSLNDEMDAEFWLPPEAEHQEDDIIGSVGNYDDDDDDEAKPASLSYFGEEGNGGHRFKEEKDKAMNDVKNGKFKALVIQLVKSMGVDSGEDWVDIVTNLSWEAADFVKPDAHEGKAMDPDGYVKIKCVATGSRTQSQLIKGLVFKKHAAHKHMQTKYKNPRLLLIHGSLDLSSGGLSSFQSMQQARERENFASIVEMIDMYHPNVVLVEKSVSRDMQESILAKGITLVFDMKLNRMERVARCIGSPILTSDVAIGQKLRQCDSFLIEKFVEEHVSMEGGKKQSKTLMFLEGAASRLGCTILLMGANIDELKQIKCIVRFAVVMAYRLMLETCFLLDQTAMFSTILHGTNSDGEADIHISNELQNQISSLQGNSPLPGFSISTSIQRVTGDSFPLFFDSLDERNQKDKAEVVLDSESILVLMSSRNALQGNICEHRHFSNIKFYRSLDVPLGIFLQDNLFNQRLECKTCGEHPEAHFFYYALHNKQLTIQVKHLPARKSLPGEADGRLWMWSRCCQCKIRDGNSESTKRVLISKAARGLSFGKFLELSFLNYSSFSNSSCGHSYHKDFLHFFGLGPMVAMFKYSTLMDFKYSVGGGGEFLENNVCICIHVFEALKSLCSSFM